MASRVDDVRRSAGAAMKECHTMEPSHTLDHEIPQTELKASVRPSASSLLPTTSEPETREQRLGEHRNSAYKEKVSVRRVDPEAEEDRRRVMITLGLEVALAMFLTLASKLWGWAREERARARVNRELRRRIPAT
jgi:hypothetical protein